MSRRWKLNSKGYYLNQISDNILAIIKPGHLYQGGYLQDGERVVPNGEGVLITETGMFTGSFKVGQPQGNGSYYDRVNGTIYQGSWNQGKLERGKMSREDF